MIGKSALKRAIELNAVDDFETWLIETGDVIIRKEDAEDAEGAASLTTAENAVYDLWAVDYAVRNAGDIEALDDVRPGAAKSLANFLKSEGATDLSRLMADLAKSGDDCDAYFDFFEELCATLYAAYEEK